MTLLPERVGRPRHRPPGAFWLLLVVAALHTFLGVHEGLEDGDYSLLYADAPFVLLTLLAASCTLRRARWAATTAVVLASLSVALATVTVGFYLIGLFHLPQAIAAALITVRHEGPGAER